MPTDLRTHWNHNTHYHRLVLRSLPDGARTALDVGTGDGLLAADLREHVPDVTGIDLDRPSLDRARALRDDVTWIEGDALTYPLPEGHFDLVASIAAVHHFPDLGAGLTRLAALTAPGGRLVVVALARNARPADFLADFPGIVQHQVLARTRGLWEHGSPISEPRHTYAEARRIAADALPGMRWRRLPLFRYALTWRRPG